MAVWGWSPTLWRCAGAGRTGGDRSFAHMLGERTLVRGDAPERVHRMCDSVLPCPLTPTQCTSNGRFTFDGLLHGQILQCARSTSSPLIYTQQTQV